MDDPYLDLIDGQWNNIAILYLSFQDKNPILEYDAVKKKIFSYQAMDYVNELTERTRNRTKKLYKEACNNNQFMLFVRDENNNKLRSYIFDIPE